MHLDIDVPEDGSRFTSGLVCLFLSVLTITSACDYRDGQDQMQPAGSVVNSAGKTLPPDAAPLDRQIIRSITAEPKTLDLTIDAYSAGDVIHLFEPLAIVTAGMVLTPGAAERWESNPDGTRWTFHMRKGNRWSDGHPVTAHDFEYGLKRLLDPKEASNYAFVYYDITGARDFNVGENPDRDAVGIRAEDDYTLVIETDHPTPYLPKLMAFVTSNPVPKWQVEKFGQKWTQGNNCIASGPYMIDEWIQGRDLTFVLNPQYSGPNTGYLERIRWIFSNDPSAHLTAYENNEIDTHALSPVELTQVERDPKLRQQLIRSHGMTSWYLFFKTQTPPFNDMRVRQAIAHAFDREALCSTVLKGVAIPAYTMLPPGMPDHLGTQFKAYQQYDPALARRLMAEAGYPDGRGFPKIDLWLRQANPMQQQVAQGIQSMLKETLGITVTLKNEEQQMYFDNMYRYDIPFSLVPFTQDFADPVNMITMVWRSHEVGAGRHDWKNPAFDRLVDLAGTEMDAGKRSALYREAQGILSKDAGGVFVYYQVNLGLAKPWVKNNIAGETPGYPGYSVGKRIWEVYIGQEILENR